MVFETVECTPQHIPHHMRGGVVQYQSCQCCSQDARFNNDVSVHGSLDESTHYLIPTALECDFHFPYIPENVTCCGLILLGSPSLSEVDPELETWLQKGPTVNLGSNKVSDTTLDH
jgi:hypothetical protein